MPPATVWLGRVGIGQRSGARRPRNPGARPSVAGDRLSAWIWGPTGPCWPTATRATRCCSGFLIRVPMWARRGDPHAARRHVARAQLRRGRPRHGGVDRRGRDLRARGAAGCSTAWGCAARSAPSLLVQVVCWSIAPWVGYAPLMASPRSAGSSSCRPSRSCGRSSSARCRATSAARRSRSTRSATELSFMAGPALGVWLATAWDTGWALSCVELAAVAPGSCCGSSTRRSPRSPPRRSARGTTGSGVAGEAARRRRRSPRAPPASVPTRRPGPCDPRLHHRPGRRGLPRRRLHDARPQRHRRRRSSRPCAPSRPPARSAGSSPSGVRARSSAACVYGAWHRSFSVFWLLGGLAADDRAGRARRRGAELRRAHHGVGLPLRPDDHRHRRAAEPPACPSGSAAR